MKTPAEKASQTKKLVEEGKATTYLARLNAGLSPKDAVKGLCPVAEVKSFIDSMKPMVQASFLEVAPMAQNRIMELLYAKKEALDRNGRVKELVDNDLSLKAAETLLKYAGLLDKETVVVKDSDDKGIMSAIVVND